jgi:hypothetical protein
MKVQVIDEDLNQNIRLDGSGELQIVRDSRTGICTSAFSNIPGSRKI